MAPHHPKSSEPIFGSETFPSLFPRPWGAGPGAVGFHISAVVEAGPPLSHIIFFLFLSLFSGLGRLPSPCAPFPLLLSDIVVHFFSHSVVSSLLFLVCLSINLARLSVSLSVSLSVPFFLCLSLSLSFFFFFLSLSLSLPLSSFFVSISPFFFFVCSLSLSLSLSFPRALRVVLEFWVEAIGLVFLVGWLWGVRIVVHVSCSARCGLFFDIANSQQIKDHPHP